MAEKPRKSNLLLITYYFHKVVLVAFKLVLDLAKNSRIIEIKKNTQFMQELFPEQAQKAEQSKS